MPSYFGGHLLNIPKEIAFFYALIFNVLSKPAVINSFFSEPVRK